MLCCAVCRDQAKALKAPKPKAAKRWTVPREDDPNVRKSARCVLTEEVQSGLAIRSCNQEVQSLWGGAMLPLCCAPGHWAGHLDKETLGLGVGVKFPEPIASTVLGPFAQ